MLLRRDGVRFLDAALRLVNHLHFLTDFEGVNIDGLVSLVVSPLSIVNVMALVSIDLIVPMVSAAIAAPAPVKIASAQSALISFFISSLRGLVCAQEHWAIFGITKTLIVPSLRDAHRSMNVL